MITCRKVKIDTAMLKALLPPSPARQPIFSMARKARKKAGKKRSGGRGASGKGKNSKIRKIKAWLRSRGKKKVKKKRRS
ncbi:hypothetical protein FJZ18_02590 [Candidatus Pacearchaeota archaeon]|nr:hypothetical protein [Candidatus Pacearchaeota archaeon]